MTSILRLSSACAAVLAVAACSTPTPVGIKPSDVPQAFTAPIPQNAKVWPTLEWWQSFSSDELTALESKAQTDNLDLAVAESEVLQAQAQTGIQASALFPDIGLDANASRTGTSTSVQAANLPPGLHIPNTRNDFGVSLQASYQLDIWGEAQDNLRSAQEALRSSEYAQETVALTVEADVANAYFDVLALREEVAITKQNIDAAERILTITKAKVTNGVSSNLDLAQQEATLAQQQAALPGLEEQEREARYSLAILLGKPPEGFDVAAQNLNGIAPPMVAPGLPSELLLRRPDVQEAEATLASAHASVDAARAAFFPAIGLTGSGGYESPAIATLFNPTSFGWSIGASLLETIFNGGLHAAESDLAKAKETQQIATYRKTVISAFQNTETALGQVSSYADQQEKTEEEVKAAAEAFRISELQYREGIIELLTVLQAQQTLFNAENALVQTKLARLEAVISLYQALGGGWTPDQTPLLPDSNPLRPF